MSGSGNSEGFGGGGGGISSFDCRNISIKTSIMSPDPEVLASLKENDILSISLQTVTGPIIATTTSGRILGSVFITKLTDLINCLNEGHSFQAVILAISGGVCQILISSVI